MTRPGDFSVVDGGVGEERGETVRARWRVAAMSLTRRRSVSRSDLARRYSFGSR